MLPSTKEWVNIVSNLGINNSDHVIIYDNSDVFSSCRVWYTFLYFGHNSDLISVLDGNFKKWINEKRSTSKEIKKIIKSNYTANENSQLVLSKDQINKNIISKKLQLIDARGEQRFLGLQPEPRKELKSGNIKGSKNLPFQELINKENRTFKNKKELITIFKKKEILIDKEIAFTCGSGVNACILGLANSIISGKKPVIYDGSWAEYGLK
jgi:thiosulfate/3-mercaptopyruvate sulfurtransferase